MDDKGEIIAADNQTDKLGTLESTARRWKILSIKTTTIDATDNGAVDGLGSFDRVLVDAPCSGLGTLRRNPEIRWRLSEQKLREYPLLQRRMLGNAAACVRKAGILLYSTCSVMQEENDAVVEAFLEEHPDFSILEPAPHIPAEVVGPKGFLRTCPHRHGTDGFFGALLQRR
jgi:16S rRNA (cytosine967-C5)-methyltransferase